jgi:hypothetical protein
MFHPDQEVCDITLIVFLNVFFIAFVLVTILGLLARGITSD